MAFVCPMATSFATMRPFLSSPSDAIRSRAGNPGRRCTAFQENAGTMPGGLNNGRTEGLNGKTRVITRRAYGCQESRSYPPSIRLGTGGVPFSMAPFPLTRDSRCHRLRNGWRKTDTRTRSSQVMRSIRISGLLGLLLAIPSGCGSSTDKAASCSAVYALGCVGDGREVSATTPENYPTTGCSKDDYTYFDVHMSTSAYSSTGSPRSEIEACYLEIADSSGRVIERYSLPSVDATGGAAGCSGGLTGADIGLLSYSSCCATDETLQFTLDALSSDGTVIETGTARGPCSPKGTSNEVHVTLSAK